MEELRERDRVNVPDTIRFPVSRVYRKFLSQINSEIESYHRSNETNHLTRGLELSLRLIDQMNDDITQTQLNHNHEIRLLKSKLNSFITIKKSKKDDADEEF